MITKEKNRTKIICAVVTAISAIVAGGSAFQLYNVQNISQTVNGNVIQILGETGSYVSAGTDLTDSTDELISAYRKVLDENSQYQANQSTLQGQVQSLQNENDDLKNQIQKTEIQRIPALPRHTDAFEEVPGCHVEFGSIRSRFAGGIQGRVWTVHGRPVCG